MKNIVAILGLLACCSTACSSGGGAFESLPGTNRLRIELNCAVDSDCPADFACETEFEHGVANTFCESREDVDHAGGSATCPAGYELEVEHGVSFCKPHHHGGEGGAAGDDGGHDSGDDSGPGRAGDSRDNSGPGNGEGGSDDDSRGHG